MDYSNSATGKTPAHIIYLLDASGSMASEMPGTNKRKIDFISDILEEVAYQVYLRSRRGNVISDRYRLSVLAYNNVVKDLTNGDYISVKEFIQNIPEFGDLGNYATNTFEAMKTTKKLLEKTISKIDSRYPPPIVCHLTDGEFTNDYGDPSNLMREIMNMDTPDGKVLLQNIFLGDKLLAKPVSNTKEWVGVTGEQELSEQYTKFLYNHSSVWPNRYVEYFNKEYKFNLKPNTRMFFPAEDVNTIKMAFTASTATPRGTSAPTEEV
ncbi:MAG: hypothetical protein KPEEDBHJ_03445 [Anaerolineales bacterium]|nr:hypothetical protein [Anaerolineales bacterium]